MTEVIILTYQEEKESAKAIKCILKLDGVFSATVNLDNSLLTVNFDENIINKFEIVNCLKRKGISAKLQSKFLSTRPF